MTDTILDGRDLKTFVGAKDFETSRNFYSALGFKLNFDAGDLAELELNGCKFYLQDYYRKTWCNNMMLHMTVSDATAWFEHVKAVLNRRKYGAARVKEPQEEDYGALVTHVWDPSGVLWHLAEPLSN